VESYPNLSVCRRLSEALELWLFWLLPWSIFTSVGPTCFLFTNAATNTCKIKYVACVSQEYYSDKGQNKNWNYFATWSADSIIFHQELMSKFALSFHYYHLGRRGHGFCQPFLVSFCTLSQHSIHYKQNISVLLEEIF